MVHILIIDDDVQTHKQLKAILESNYNISSAYTGKHGLKKTTEISPDLVLLDINLPDEDGVSILSKIMNFPAPPGVIMLSAFTDKAFIVDTIRKGASEYLFKPYTLIELNEVIEKTLMQSNRNMTPFNSALWESKGDFYGIIGESPEINNLKKQILKCASKKCHVLIQGESGTGKELIANAIHKISKRKGKLRAINCGAIPEQLLESELFGSVKGAFTDAMLRTGSIEEANNGTVFLDEIGELSLSAQVKLLRVIEEKEIVKLGSNRIIPLDFRVISATNKKLKKLMKEGKFREDLYFRINVFPIRTVPLREHKDDIPLLSAFFIKKIALENNLKSEINKEISEKAMNKLLNYSWPGNIRELRNILDRAITYSEKEIIIEEDIILEKD